MSQGPTSLRNTENLITINTSQASNKTASTGQLVGATKTREVKNLKSNEEGKEFPEKYRYSNSVKKEEGQVPFGSRKTELAGSIGFKKETAELKKDLIQYESDIAGIGEDNSDLPVLKQVIVTQAKVKNEVKRVYKECKNLLKKEATKIDQCNKDLEAVGARLSETKVEGNEQAQGFLGNVKEFVDIIKSEETLLKKEIESDTGGVKEEVLKRATAIIQVGSSNGSIESIRQELGLPLIDPRLTSFKEEGEDILDTLAALKEVDNSLEGVEGLKEVQEANAGLIKDCEAICCILAYLILYSVSLVLLKVCSMIDNLNNLNQDDLGVAPNKIDNAVSVLDNEIKSMFRED